MVLYCFCLMDNKAGFFGQPFMFPSRGQAVRAIQDLVADPTTMAGKHPADFNLFEVGTWDDQTGRYTDQIPEHICSCVSLLPRATKGEANQ